MLQESDLLGSSPKNLTILVPDIPATITVRVQNGEYLENHKPFPYEWQTIRFQNMIFRVCQRGVNPCKNGDIFYKTKTTFSRGNA
jgi:hypothetical protein